MRIRKEPIVVSLFAGVLFASAYFEWRPVRAMMDWKAATNTRSAQSVDNSIYELIDHSGGEEPFITVDFVKGKHFWHPQVAIWLEDSVGNYIETLVVTTSTAQGLFYSGRSAQNFKEYDSAKSADDAPTRRVDALPVWSHKKGPAYADGFHSPPPNQHLPDGITMATPNGNFLYKGNSSAPLNSFRVMVEINVAFDENEYYSEYDFVEDSLYHGGTGLLGQPSIVYGAVIRNIDANNYYVLQEIGRGHHSGGDGSIQNDLNTLTTARHIVERLVVGVNEEWYSKKE
jgi:hypothetical protein